MADFWTELVLTTHLVEQPHQEHIHAFAAVLFVLHQVEEDVSQLEGLGQPQPRQKVPLDEALDHRVAEPECGSLCADVKSCHGSSALPVRRRGERVEDGRIRARAVQRRSRFRPKVVSAHDFGAEDHWQVLAVHDVLHLGNHHTPEKSRGRGQSAFSTAFIHLSTRTSYLFTSEPFSRPFSALLLTFTLRPCPL